MKRNLSVLLPALLSLPSVAADDPRQVRPDDSEPDDFPDQWPPSQRKPAALSKFPDVVPPDEPHNLMDERDRDLFQGASGPSLTIACSCVSWMATISSVCPWSGGTGDDTLTGGSGDNKRFLGA